MALAGLGSSMRAVTCGEWVRLGARQREDEEGSSRLVPSQPSSQIILHATTSSRWSGDRNPLRTLARALCASIRNSNSIIVVEGVRDSCRCRGLSPESGVGRTYETDRNNSNYEKLCARATDGTYIVVNTEMKCRMYRVNETPRAQRRDDATGGMLRQGQVKSRAAVLQTSILSQHLDLGFVKGSAIDVVCLAPRGACILWMIKHHVERGRKEKGYSLRWLISPAWQAVPESIVDITKSRRVSTRGREGSLADFQCHIGSAGAKKMGKKGESVSGNDVDERGRRGEGDTHFRTQENPNKDCDVMGSFGKQSPYILNNPKINKHNICPMPMQPLPDGLVTELETQESGMVPMTEDERPSATCAGSKVKDPEPEIRAPY
ncbi:hypothetical protein C8J57DRAFT_1246096 [Mycena rebaudengoi]|nr:hypothetical protein C8J57DRAFT_1246096 [Mycena rebaudengoi]